MLSLSVDCNEDDDGPDRFEFEYTPGLENALKDILATVSKIRWFYSGTFDVDPNGNWIYDDKEQATSTETRLIVYKDGSFCFKGYDYVNWEFYTTEMFDLAWFQDGRRPELHHYRLT